MVYVIITHDFQTVYQKWLDGLNSKKLHRDLVVHNPHYRQQGRVHEGGTAFTVDVNSEERIVEVHVFIEKI